MEISKIEYSEAVEVGSILKKSPSLTSKSVVKDVLEHINDGLALKFVDEGKILGVWCSKEYEGHVSLSFFYADESIRRKPQLAVFFSNCIKLINRSKPLLLSTNDTTGFDKYVVKIGDELYQFIGVR